MEQKKKMKIYLLIVNTWKHLIPISINDLTIFLKWIHPNGFLDPFSNTETIDSPKLEDKLIEVTTNEELKLEFKEGYHDT